MNEDETNIFLDKIKLSLVVLEKESSLIETYSDLIKKINNGSIKIEKINEWTLYYGSWNLVHELYNFLRFNKIKDIKNKKKKDGKLIKDIKELENAMIKYENPDNKVTFKELQGIMPTIHSIISLSGYHDDKFHEKGGGLEDEEY